MGGPVLRRCPVHECSGGSVSAPDQTHHAVCPVAEDTTWREIENGVVRRQPLFRRVPLTPRYRDRLYPLGVSTTPPLSEVRSCPTQAGRIFTAGHPDRLLMRMWVSREIAMSTPPPSGGSKTPIRVDGDDCAFPSVALGRGQTPNPVAGSPPHVPERYLLPFLLRSPEKPQKRQMVK